MYKCNSRKSTEVKMYKLNPKILVDNPFDESYVVVT